MAAKLKARVPQVEQPQFAARTNTLLDRALELGAMPASTRQLRASRSSTPAGRATQVTTSKMAM